MSDCMNQQKKELADHFQKTGLNLLDFEISGSYQEFNIKFKHDYIRSFGYTPGLTE